MCCRPSSATARSATGSSTTPASRKRAGTRWVWHANTAGNSAKQDGCRVAVTLAVANERASLPIAYRLDLPEGWAGDPARRARVGVPEEVAFRTRPRIALRADPPSARRRRAGRGGAGGCRLRRRHRLPDRPHRGVTRATSSASRPRPASGRRGNGAAAAAALERPRAAAAPRPAWCRAQADRAAAELAEGLPAAAWHTVAWREGGRAELSSRFAAVRVRPAHRDDQRPEARPGEWLLIEWPAGESEATKYWLSTVPAAIGLKESRWPRRRRAGGSSATPGSSSGRSGSGTTRAAAGAASTTMPPCASPPAASSSPSGAVFPPSGGSTAINSRRPPDPPASGRAARVAPRCGLSATCRARSPRSGVG